MGFMSDFGFATMVQHALTLFEIFTTIALPVRCEERRSGGKEGAYLEQNMGQRDGPGHRYS